MSYLLPTNPEEKLEQKLQTKKTKSLELDVEDRGLEMPQVSA